MDVFGIKDLTVLEELSNLLPLQNKVLNNKYKKIAADVNGKV